MALAKEPLHYLLLLFICCSLADAAAKLSTTAPCLPDQASSLLQLKNSFIGANLSSWQAGTDCCHWEGVTCDVALGRVISLDLGGFDDLVSHSLDPALFNLTSLRNLSLAFVDFSYALLPAFGFERLTDLIHLNLSRTHFMGQIPIGMACLKNLVTLDLSYNYELYFEQPSFQTFMANMINLRELYLDEVDLSSAGSTWSTVLADSVPQLQILSLFQCRISGSIHPSFSRLRSLTSINLGYNSELTGKVPEYFSELSSLTILYISSCNFEGNFPTKIFQLKSLRTLDLYGNPMLYVRLTYFPVGNNLETLNLAGTNFSYDTPSSFANLQSLKELGLNTMGIGNELPSLISKLPSLDDLLLMGSDLEKLVLSWLGNFTQLTSLELDGYDFSKSVPTWIGKLTSLERLTIWDCNFLVPIPYQIGNLTKLTSLGIYNCNFSGPIPSTIGNLIQLERLALWSSNFSGKILRSLFSLPALQVIYLIDNQLVGSLEDIPAPLSSPLREIDLSQNQLTGPIPKSFFQLTNLTYLNLESNQLTDTIELGSVWRLKSLNLLDLGNNMISLIEKEGDTILSPSPKIRYLHLASCNLTKFPTAFKYLDTIQALDLSNNKIKEAIPAFKFFDTIQELNLSNNKIEGAIPSWVWGSGLEALDLSHNLFTTLEKSHVVQITDLFFLDLSFNRLQGSIPVPSTSFNKLAVLDYSNNNFSSIDPNFGRYLRNAIYIDLSNNKLDGNIPFSLCSLNNLEILNLSFNYFSGPIPSCLMERSKLTILKLRENKLRGVLPENIREGCKLETIDLNGNRINGALPRSLAHCQDLEVLDVGNNQIVGSFPSWMGTLPKLRILFLRSNKLNGTIRDLENGYQYFTSMQIMDLASNHFSGDLHSEFFEKLRGMMDSSNDDGQILVHDTNLSYKRVYQDTITITYKYATFSVTRIQTAFKVIDFSNNSFEGSIPDSIGRLVSLHGLNMSHNNFTGQLPSKLGNLMRLESLDLSGNYLSGEIPQEFTSLTSLSWLNVSYNNLTGRIPQGNQFLSFPSSSFEGNAGLCGIQISKECDTLDPNSTISPRVLAPEHNTLWQDRLDAIILFIFVGLGFGVGFALAIILSPFCHIEGWICKHMDY